MNNFQKALLDSVQKEFSDIPPETEIGLPALPVNRKPHPSLRLGLIVAVITLLLIGATFATVHFPLGSQVESNLYTAPDCSLASHAFHITFREDIASPNAPEVIEEYFLPTAIVSKETLNPYQTYIVDGDQAVELHDPISEGHSRIRYDWTVDGHQITFSQRTTKSLDPQTPLNYYFVDIDIEKIKVDYETIVVGEYEILCLTKDYTESDLHPLSDSRVSHTWIWSDGNYLYELYAWGSYETMLELFESIAPVKDIQDYLGSEKP